MKRIYTIGRDESCDIVIVDSTNTVSRNHATLRIDGKRCYLTDQSTNGTYRNGIRLVPDIEYPVSKKDEISFASVASFDWNAIPELQVRHRPVWLYVFLPLAVLLLAGSLYYFWPVRPIQKVEDEDPLRVAKDSLDRAQQPTDSVKQDSLVVLEDILSKKKVKKKSTKSIVPQKTPDLSHESFKNYKDEDDEIVPDAL